MAPRSGSIATPPAARPRRPRSAHAWSSSSRDLGKLADGLTKPRTQKTIAAIQQRIGRLKEKTRAIGEHYEITVIPDATGLDATAITWKQTPAEGSKLTHPGVYCLRSNETAWDDTTLWCASTMLTDLEAVFRGLKSDLGLRPVFHHTEDRTEGHLFITVLASVHLVQIIRRKPPAKGEHICHGPVCTRSWPCSSAPPPPSTSATATRRTSARPPSPNQTCARFTMPCRSIRRRAGQDIAHDPPNYRRRT